MYSGSYVVRKSNPRSNERPKCSFARCNHGTTAWLISLRFLVLLSVPSSDRHAHQKMVGSSSRGPDLRKLEDRHSVPLQEAWRLNNNVIMMVLIELKELHQPAARPVLRPGESGAKHRNTPNPMTTDILRYIPVRRPSDPLRSELCHTNYPLQAIHTAIPN